MMRTTVFPGSSASLALQASSAVLGLRSAHATVEIARSRFSESPHVYGCCEVNPWQMVAPAFRGTGILADLGDAVPLVRGDSLTKRHAPAS